MRIGNYSWSHGSSLTRLGYSMDLCIVFFFVVFRVNVAMHTRKAGSSYNGFLAQRYGNPIGPHEVISHGPGYSTYD